jgi:hypothetical protein
MANNQGKRRSRGIKDITHARELPQEQLGDEVHESRYPIHLTEDDRLNVRIGWTDRDGVVEWFLGQQVRVADRWEDVVTYDCSHGEPVHRHLFRRTATGSKRYGRSKKVAERTDLEAGYDMVYGLIVEEVNDQRERYLRG